jgi:crotonobetainyl-CoA:carnitine CoA-transferase CaiB-like acyl-CoA transferase
MNGLEDVRVLAVEQYGAGPFGTLHLADLGAEVIKIEDPRAGGDVGRYIPPFQEDADSLFFESFNRNKRSIVLDLEAEAGRRAFHELVARSDAVFSNLRGDVPDRLGLRYRDLCRFNARIVCCSLSGFGLTGPRQAEPAYDYVIQGLAGWMSLTGEPDGPPAKSGLSLVDYSSGIVAALSLLAGIHAARRDGHGGDCDVSLFDTAISMLTYPAAWWLSGAAAVERTARSSHPSIVPFGAFPTADGWLVVACPKEKFWLRMASAVGRSDLASDPRFDSFEARRHHREELIAALDGILRRETTEHWLGHLTSAGVPCGPVNSVAEALEDPQTRARNLVVEVDHPRWGRIREVTTAARGWWSGPDQRRAPALGEDRDSLLTELLGYSAAQLAALRKAGAFGSQAGSA